MASTPRSRAGSAGLLGLLAATAACLFVASLGIGAVPIHPLKVLAALGEGAGLALPWEAEPRHKAIILSIRLPRTLLGLLAGASLGAAGALIQGLFRNPLAEPGLIGVSSGAALGAAGVIVLGGQALGGTFALPLAAFAGAVAATFAVYALSSINGQASVGAMLLVGIAVNALAQACVGLLIFLASDAQIRSLAFWNLGSLGGATWASLKLSAPFMLLALSLSLRLAGPLNALLLGEAEARHLGVDVSRLKLLIAALAALAVGSAVAVTGLIGFVGLVAPHLARLAAGPDHRAVLPGSALLGACLLMAADIAARTLAAPAELPIGILTAFLGAPFFLYLLAAKKGSLFHEP